MLQKLLANFKRPLLKNRFKLYTEFFFTDQSIFGIPFYGSPTQVRSLELESTDEYQMAGSSNKRIKLASVSRKN